MPSDTTNPDQELPLQAKARNTNLWLSYDGTPLGSGPDATMIEAPVLRTHTVGLCLWAAVAVVLVLQVVLYSRRGDVDGFVNHIEQHNDTDCHDWEYDCYFGHEGRITVALTFSGLGFIDDLRLCLQTPEQHPEHWLTGIASPVHREHHTAHVYARTTLHQRALGMSTFVLCFVGYTAINFDSCATRYLTLLGLLPMHVVFASTVAWGLFYDTPVDESMQVRAQQVKWLQAFAWAEADKERLIKERACRITTPKPEPMFCFQTAVNMWYFSALVYHYKQPNQAKTTSRDVLDHKQLAIQIALGSPIRRSGTLPHIVRTVSIASSAEGLQAFSRQDSLSDRSDSIPSASSSMPLGITRSALMGMQSSRSLPGNISRSGILQAAPSRDSESDTASQADSHPEASQPGQPEAEAQPEAERGMQQEDSVRKDDDAPLSPRPGRLQRLMKLLRPAKRKAGNPANDEAVVMCCGCLDNEWADGGCSRCRLSGFQLWLQSVCDLFSCATLRPVCDCCATDFCLELRNPSKGEEDMLSDLSPAALQPQGPKPSSDITPSSGVPESPFAAQRFGRPVSGADLGDELATRPSLPSQGSGSGLTSAFSLAQASSMRSRRRAYEKRKARRKQKQDFLLDLALSLYNLHR
ncbi:hypothetical protein MMC29_000928 [Sticta canariensis]|nr:hypothetical protein [Sticta canariensis]